MFPQDIRRGGSVFRRLPDSEDYLRGLLDAYDAAPNLQKSTAVLSKRTSRVRLHGPDHDRLAWPGAVAPSLPPTPQTRMN